MELGSSVAILKGVGPQLTKQLAAVGIDSVADLIEYYPRRYDDYSLITDISMLKPGPVTIKAQIKQIKGRYVRRGLHITEAVASDDSGSVRLVWFNQPYRANNTKLSSGYFISGLYELSRQRLAIMNPSIELVSDFPANTARIVPVYRESKGLKSAYIRHILKEAIVAIRNLDETLPAWLIKEEGLISRAEAIEHLHFPDNATQLAAAKKRLSFEEIFELNLAALLNKAEIKREHALKVKFDESLAKNFVAHLPFKLTDAQRRVAWQIYKDMQSPQPMNRLVEGDVGSGKTVVAAMAAVMAMKQGLQVALMAPTEILARQHAETIYKLLEPLGYGEQVSLLTGSIKTSAKTHLHRRIKSGEAGFIVGTHALIQSKVSMKKLGLIIVDEQHRFGVEQRKKLQAKAGHMPHVLTMTATPIPRSLALTLYGELDISVLDELPVGRLPVLTKIVSPNSRSHLYRQIDKEIDNARQVFIVCPLIVDSLTLKYQSAEKLYSALKNGVFKHRRVGLLHGKMKIEQKEAAMQAFVSRKIDILVATTVVEVGVDVPNASVMLIENADRFGLAQIHQLRGRIGRGGHQGYCYLMMSGSSVPTKRLLALQSSSDGFKLAELDLELRGPGAIYGTLQHGRLDLKIAKLTDHRLIASARQAAQEFLDKKENLLKYKQLHSRVNSLRAITTLN